MYRSATIIASYIESDDTLLIVHSDTMQSHQLFSGTSVTLERQTVVRMPCVLTWKWDSNVTVVKATRETASPAVVRTILIVAIRMFSASLHVRLREFINSCS